MAGSARIPKKEQLLSSCWVRNFYGDPYNISHIWSVNYIIMTTSASIPPLIMVLLVASAFQEVTALATKKKVGRLVTPVGPFLQVTHSNWTSDTEDQKWHPKNETWNKLKSTSGNQTENGKKYTKCQWKIKKIKKELEKLKGSTNIKRNGREKRAALLTTGVAAVMMPGVAALGLGIVNRIE